LSLIRKEYDRELLQWKFGKRISYIAWIKQIVIPLTTGILFLHKIYNDAITMNKEGYFVQRFRLPMVNELFSKE
jgi:hypothetical protein